MRDVVEHHLIMELAEGGSLADVIKGDVMIKGDVLKGDKGGLVRGGAQGGPCPQNPQRRQGPAVGAEQMVAPRYVPLVFRPFLYGISLSFFPGYILNL